MLYGPFSFAVSIGESYTINTFFISLVIISRLITQDGHFVEFILVVIKFVILNLI